MKKFYVLDWQTSSIRLFDSNGNLIKHFTPEETFAAIKYKQDSKDFHNILRKGKKVKKEEEVQIYIKDLSALFKNGKAWHTTEDMVVYRALDKQSLKTIMSMPQDGLIFEDPSFMSVASKKSSIYQFLGLRNYNHIMKIKLPKGTPYLNLDDLGHIIIPQASEDEMLLKNGSRLLIKSRKGVIEAEYLQ